MKVNIGEYQVNSLALPTKAAHRNKQGNTKSILQREISIGRNRLGATRKEAFYTELAILLRAGLDLKTSLELTLAGQKKESKVYQIFATITASVLQGSNLSEAMEQTGKFTTYEVFSVRIAEESGKLPPILEELAQYFQKSLQYRRLLTSALSYPILVIGVSVLAVVFLLQFLVPMFGDIYARLDQELPPITQMIVGLSNWIQWYSGYIFVGLVIMGVLMFWQRKMDWFRKYSAAIIIRMPVIGSLLKQLYLARFTQAMAFLLTAKVPLITALELVRQMIGLYPIEQAVQNAEHNIIRGQSFHSCLADYTIFDRKIIALIKVGEEANQLAAIFGKLADQLNNEVEQKTKMIGSLIEPILIVFLALIVGLVLVSMYLPIFKLVTNFG